MPPPASATSKRNSAPLSTSLTKCTRRSTRFLSSQSNTSQLTSPALRSILTAKKVLRFADALQLPVFITTQNRARLGPTVTDLDPFLSRAPAAQADKTRFSMWIPPLTQALPANLPDIVLVGIEAHICITQTALDARRAGHRVYVLADGVSSCNKEEVPIALARLRAEGVVVTTSESWLYEVVGDAGAAEFKGLIGIVKESMADTRSALGALAPVAGSGGTSGSGGGSKM